METLNKRAWNVLTPEEQTAVTLRIVENLSTLKAGKIMDKAHYKFLEIFERGKAFLRIFQEFLVVHEDPIPSYVKITSEFREYLTCIIIHRMTIKEACSQLSSPAWMYKKHREQEIIKNMLALHRSKHAYNQEFETLIKDFDRWNNFRILPYSVQDPSAFKRRNKNAEIKNITHILNINPFSLKLIMDKYSFQGKSSKAKVGYAIGFENLDNRCKVKIFKVHINNKGKDKILATLGELGFYIFKSKDDALIYSTMAMEYNLKEGKDCKFGQEFWPKYRLHTQKSFNYNFIRKLIPSRKYYTDVLADWDLRLSNKT